MKRLKVLLVTPPYHCGVVEAAGTWMPLSLVYLAGAARRAGAEVMLYDALSLQVGHDEIRRQVEAFAPDLVGVTAITAMEPDARVICRTVKEVAPRAVTILGNTHPTFMWREILTEDPAVDLIAIGEGEDTLFDLVSALQAGDDLDRVRGIARRVDGVPTATAPRPFCGDLDQLTPAWDLLDWPIYKYRPHPDGQLAIVGTSRGCQKACAFCSQQKFWQRSWRARTPESIVAELTHLRDVYDVRVAMFSDETPTVDRERWVRLLDLLVARRVGVELLMETRVDDIIRDADLLDRYREAGVSHIYVGVEATQQKTLDLFNKETEVAQGKRAIELINAAGIVSETSFVLGTPDETREGIERTVELAKWYGPDMAFFLALTPWPYADIYPKLAGHVATHDYRRYNLVEPVIQPDGMTIDEMRAALAKATGAFFHDKFARLGELTPYKRQYMVSVLKLLIEHSYLGAEMKKMAQHGRMPESVREMLKELGIGAVGVAAG